MFLINSYRFGVAVDADAQAFITAASITDATQKSAVNQLVLDLKAASIWTKMLAVYPFIGSSASSHKWNLKDPRDLDAAYRLSFAGGWTHTSTGGAHNGTNAYAQTHWAMDDITYTDRINNFHISYYSRTQNLTGDGWVMGRGNMDNGNPLYGLAIKRATSGLRIFDSGNISSPSGRISGAETDGRGFYLGARTSSTSTKLYKNGTSVLSSTGLVGHDAYGFGVAIGAMYGQLSAVPGYLYQGAETAFASFGAGLNDSEAAALSTAVATFNITLSRNV